MLSTKASKLIYFLNVIIGDIFRAEMICLLMDQLIKQMAKKR